MTPVVLPVEVSLPSEVSRCILLSFRCLLCVECLVLLGVLDVECLWRRGCVEGRCGTILNDTRGCTLIESVTSIPSGTRVDSRIQTRSSIRVQVCVALSRANVVL